MGFLNFSFWTISICKGCFGAAKVRVKVAAGAAVLGSLFSLFASAEMPTNLIWQPQHNFSHTTLWFRDEASAVQEQCRLVTDYLFPNASTLTYCGKIGTPIELPPASSSFNVPLWAQYLRIDLDVRQFDPDLGQFTGVILKASYDHYSVIGRPPEYSAILTNVLNPPKICAANPIDISSGAKIQAESENFGVADLPFFINYNSSNPLIIPPVWLHNFQDSIHPLDLNNSKQVRSKSGSYTTKAQACTSGWNEIKAQINQPWLQNTVASYACDLCEIKSGNARVAILPIVVAATPYSEVGASTQEAVRLKRSNGSESTFIHLESCGQNEWRSVEGEAAAVLQSDVNGNFQLFSASGKVESYNHGGQLQTIAANNGYTQTLTYDSVTKNLTKVTSSSGHQLDLGYINNQLRSITVDNTKTTSFSYGDNGLINMVTRPDTTTRQYHYEDTRFPKFLTGITDERNVRYATWKYDAQGRAISSEHAGGAEKTTLAFNADGTTTVTNPLGKKTTYLFDDILGVKHVKKVTGEPTASCVGANQDYTYTPEGFIDTQTDWKGNITKFGYDSFGRQILRTQAFGTTDATTTETCWHPTLNQPSRLIEPSKITLYDYWPNGQFKSQIIKPRPAGVVDCAAAL